MSYGADSGEIGLLVIVSHEDSTNFVFTSKVGANVRLSDCTDCSIRSQVFICWTLCDMLSMWKILLFVYYAVQTVLLSVVVGEK